MPGRSRLPSPDPEAFGRLSERIARFLGTGKFLVAQTALIFLWIIWNLVVPKSIRFDGYPFQFLTLVLSLQAAYAAPLILLAQNRQDDRDRANLAQDREQNAMLTADAEYITREVASLRVALGDMVTRDFLRAELRDPAGRRHRRRRGSVPHRPARSALEIQGKTRKREPKAPLDSKPKLTKRSRRPRPDRFREPVPPSTQAVHQVFEDQQLRSVSLLVTCSRTPRRWTGRCLVRRTSPAAVRTASLPRRSSGNGVPRHVTVAHEPVDQAREAAATQQHRGRQVVHAQREVGSLRELQQHVVVGERELPLGSELYLEQANDSGMGREKSTPSIQGRQHRHPACSP